jgi:hypothetical protein
MDNHENYMVLAYPEQLRRPHDAPRHHEFRDGHAAMLLTELLKPAVCCGIFFNQPYPQSWTPQQQQEDIEAKLRNIDLLVLATRPPMHDPAQSSIAKSAKGGRGPKKIVRRSGNWLEEEIFKRLKPVFLKCARGEVAIRTDPTTGVERLSLGHDDDAAVDDGGPKWTPCFLIYLGALWIGGPALFCSFGMSGPMTLVWSYLLATRADVRGKVGVAQGVRLALNAGESRLIVAAVQNPAIDRTKKSLSFADNWEIKKHLDLLF